MSLTHVWQPISIGSVEVKNRIARSANCTTLYPKLVEADFVAYHLARARAGTGLTILEAGSVHHSSQIAYRIDDEDTLLCFEKLVAAVRPHGMRIFQQLWHGGHNLPGTGGTMPWAPSATPSPLTGIIGVPMMQQDIDEVAAAFGKAAKLCRDAGLDGVEIHAGHGYLVQQFLCPLTNLREDGYNGDLHARMRFLIEILERVRADVGAGFPVGVRVSASFAKGGLGADDVAIVAKRLEALGLIDFLDISITDYFNMALMAASMVYPSGHQLEINAPIAKAVKLPRIVTGRYRTLEEADQVLRDDQADMVSMVRAMIADPDLVSKTREGRAEDVRPCIACNQGCQGGLLTIGRMQCTVNPAAGYEATLSEELIAKVAQPKKVMIIGGGPSGLEAARVAALSGHKVVLAEASPRLGGTLNVARRAPHLHILGDLIDWLERQVYALGVEVRLNTYVEAEDVAKEQHDVLIVATGGMTIPNGRQAAIPGELPPGMEQPHVFDAAEIVMAPADKLAGKKTALVFDDVGRYPAIAAAEHLAKAGLAVTFVTSQPAFAPKMAGTNRDYESLQRLSRGPFRLLVSHHLVEVGADYCVVRPLGAAQTERIAADIAVVVMNQVPVRDLYEALRSQVADTRLVGDALSPRDLLAAMHEAHRQARTI